MSPIQVAVAQICPLFSAFCGTQVNPSQVSTVQVSPAQTVFATISCPFEGRLPLLFALVVSRSPPRQYLLNDDPKDGKDAAYKTTGHAADYCRLRF